MVFRLFVPSLLCSCDSGVCCGIHAIRVFVIFMRLVSLCSCDSGLYVHVICVFVMFM